MTSFLPGEWEDLPTSYLGEAACWHEALEAKAKENGDWPKERGQLVVPL
jgi:hypothetical protein